MAVATQFKINATPVFFANQKAYEDGYPLICNEGGSRCFDAETLVLAENGHVKISDIVVGQFVYTPNGLRKVLAVHKMQNTKPCFEINLKNGHVIKCTQDHKFFYNGRWLEVKDLVSLWHERNTKF